jgi:integrase
VNPVERVKRFSIAKRVPGGRAVDYELIARVLAKMPDVGQSANGHGKRARKDAIPRPKVNKTKLRLTLMAYTGLPPQLITEIQPKVDVKLNLDPPELRVRPRKKGGGTDPRWIELNPQGAEALRACIEHGAMGDFSRHAAYKSWMAAAVKVIEEQIANGEDPMRHEMGPQTRTRNGKTVTRTVIKPLVRPYDLRHSFITKSLKDADGNLPGVQHAAIHSTPQQTMMYGEGAKHHEMSKVVAAWKAPKAKKPARVLKMEKGR